MAQGKALQAYVPQEDFNVIAKYAQQELKRSISNTVKFIILEYIEKNKLREKFNSLEISNSSFAISNSGYRKVY